MWSDVDFENKLLSISRTAVVIGKKQTVQDPKTKRSKRVITLDDETLNVLKLWKRQQIKEYFQAGVPYKHDSNYIFTNNSGGWISPSAMKERLRRFFCEHNDIKKNHSSRIQAHSRFSPLLKQVLQPKSFQTG